MKLLRRKSMKLIAIILVCLLVFGLAPFNNLKADAYLPPPANDPPLILKKEANWIEDDVPTAEVTLSVKGEARDIKSDIIVLLDRSPSMYTTWCICQEHYFEEVISKEASYEIRVLGDNTWYPVSSWLTIRMTTHDDKVRPETLAGFSVTGYETQYNGYEVAAYRSGAGNVWYPDDWATVETGTGAATAGMYLRLYLKSLIGDSYPYMANFTTPYYNIDKPGINWLNGCQDPRLLGVEAAIDLADSVLQNPGDNISLISFGSGALLNNKLLTTLADFGDDINDWKSIYPTDPMSQLISQGTNNSRFTLALMAAKYYLATFGDYKLIDPNPPYTEYSLPGVAFYNTDAFDTALTDPTTALWNMLNDGILVSTSADYRVPYIVIFSSVIPIPVTPLYGFTGFTVDTTGIEVYGIGFASNSLVERNDNLEALTNGYKEDKSGNQIGTPPEVYPGHNFPQAGATTPYNEYTFNEYKGSYSRILDGKEFTRAFEDLQRNLRMVGYYDATVTDKISDGFTLDLSRPITPITADYSYDSATNILTWYVGNISELEATLTYYIKAVPPDPPDQSQSPLDGDYIEDKDTSTPFMRPNDHARIRFRSRYSPDDVYYEEDFPDPELPVEKIVYRAEYYKDGVKVDADTVEIIGYNTPLDPTIPLDNSLVDEGKYLPDYEFDELTFNDDTVTDLPERANDGDVIKIYYTAVPPIEYPDIEVTKTANPGTFTANGNEIVYTMSFTIPTDPDISLYDSIRIEDAFPLTLSLVGTTGDLVIGTTSYPGVTLDTATANKASYTLSGSQLAEAAGKTVSLALKFTVTGWESGPIKNTANLYYTPAGGEEVPGGGDDETITPDDPGIGPPIIVTPPIQVAISAQKNVTGASAGALQAGQFEFELYQNGQRLATAANDKDGNIVFNITISAKGTFVYEMKEVAKSGNTGWTIDNTVHTVTVTVTESNNVLTASVDKTPSFTNVYTPPSSPPNGNGPTTNIDDPETPLSPFISDHLAYIIGYAASDVRPQQNITRAEVTTVFFRLMTDGLRTANWTQDNTYPDVKLDDWFNNAVSVMSKMDIVRGYPNGTFGPNSAISRAELATIAARFARQMNMAQTNDRTFSDIAGHWAEADIRYAAAIGWVNGYPDGTYMPDQPITRAEFITLVNRMLERVPETKDDLLNGMITWVDNMDENEWYYLAVQEATNSHIPEYKSGDFVQGLLFNYERWQELTENRDWVQFEKSWSTANSG